MSGSVALFLDGPFAGQTKTFDRERPPTRFYLPAKAGTPLLDYVRDVNPFADGPKWVYLLDESDQSQE